jgi:hypothetical protein
VILRPLPDGPGIPQGPYRYYDLEIIYNNGDTNRVGTYEFILALTPGGAQAASGGTATATTSDASTPPSRAFDGDTSSLAWISANLPNLNRDNPHHLTYDFGLGNNKDIVEVGIGSYPGGNNARSVGIAKVRASNDGTTWRYLRTLPYMGGWTSGMVKRFDISQPDVLVARAGTLLPATNTSAKTVGKLFTPATNVTLRGVRYRAPGTPAIPDTAEVFCRVYSEAGALLSSDTSGDWALGNEADVLLNTPLALTAGTTYKVCVYSANNVQGQAHSGGASSWAGFTVGDDLLTATSDANPTTTVAERSPDFDLILV